MTAEPARGGAWVRSMPLVFAFLWSTGFIFTKLGLPYAPPITFLVLRFAAVVVLMLPIAMLFRAPWPNSPRQVAHIAVAGVLLHGGYLGGGFASIHFSRPKYTAMLQVRSVSPVRYPSTRPILS